MKVKRMSFGAFGALFVLLSLLSFVVACSDGGGDADHGDATATVPAAGDPTATEPAAENPTATVPAAENPTATAPAAENPTAAAPPAGNPTATEPAAEDPTATEPAAEPTDPAPSGTTIDVSLTEFVIGSSVGTAPAGSITFNVNSDGIILHNFIVVATDLAPDALPVDGGLFVVDEAQVDVVAKTADLNPGEQETLTVELAAGSYVLICNIPTHYQAGMTVAFTVE